MSAAKAPRRSLKQIREDLFAAGCVVGSVRTQIEMTSGDGDAVGSLGHVYKLVLDAYEELEKFDGSTRP